MKYRTTYVYEVEADSPSEAADEFVGNGPEVSGDVTLYSVSDVQQIGRYVVPIAVVVEAERVSDIDDERIGGLVFGLNDVQDDVQVIEFASLGPVERREYDEQERTVWADVKDAIDS